MGNRQRIAWMSSDIVLLLTVTYYRYLMWRNRLSITDCWILYPAHCEQYTSDACCSANATCSPNEFMCDYRRCIPTALVCDRINHCDDFSDERNCSQ